jgi:hypothetical protein
MNSHRNKSAITLMACLSAFAVSGCLSSGSGDGDAAPTQPASGGNNPPVVSGQPSSQALAGDNYSFAPSASDADGDSLSFSISNKPGWASFNGSTGALTGKPGLADEGTYENIVISVSDGSASASLPSFSVTVVTVGDRVVTLSWTPPTENNDGSQLVDLSGYRIYYGLQEGEYLKEVSINNAGIATYTIDGLLPNTYYFVATSINSQGVESAYSNAVAKEAT